MSENNGFCSVALGSLHVKFEILPTLKITFMANSKRGFVPRVQFLPVFNILTQIKVEPFQQFRP